jgi:hypothetical protein
VAIALVQQATQVNVAASSTTAPSITLAGVTAGNCLVLVANLYDADPDWTISSIADGGDTFTQYVASGLFNSTDLSRAIVAVAPNIASSGSKTVTVTMAGTSAGANRYYVFGLYEFSGVHLTTPVDDSATNSNINIGTTTDVSAGGSGFTTTDAGDMIVGLGYPVSDDATLNLGSPASWTNRYRQNDSLNFTGLDSGTWLPGSIQTNYTAQWSHDNTAGEEGCAVVIALLPSAAAAPPPATLGQFDPHMRLKAWF